MAKSAAFQKTISILVIINLLGVLVAGCGGTKVLKETQPLEITQPLTTATDRHISARLYWVIVRDGPGTWAKNADWDEYLISVVNDTGEEIQIIDVTIVDSLGTRLATNSIRKQLVKESKETIKRYKSSNLKVMAGFGSGTLAATGGAVTVGVPLAAFGVGAAVGGGAAFGVALAATGGALLLGPVLIVGAMVRGNNNNKVAQEIERRHTILPVDLISEKPLFMDIFFPLAPSPSQLEVSYLVAGAKETLVVNTAKALNGLHLVQED